MSAHYISMQLLPSIKCPLFQSCELHCAFPHIAVCLCIYSSCLLHECNVLLTLWEPLSSLGGLEALYDAEFTVKYDLNVCRKLYDGAMLS